MSSMEQIRICCSRMRYSVSGRERWNCKRNGKAGRSRAICRLVWQCADSGEWAQQFSTIPANTNAVAVANEFNQKIADLPAQNIDWSFVTDHLDDWCEEIELNYIP